MGEHDSLPDENQRRQLGELLYAAFLELRSCNDKPDQVWSLAYALHNLPNSMHGVGHWSIAEVRGMLARHCTHFPEDGIDYVAMFDAIFPSDPPRPPVETGRRLPGRVIRGRVESPRASRTSSPDLGDPDP